MDINLIRTLVCKLTCLPTTAKHLYISIRYIFKTKRFLVLQLTFTSNLKKISYQKVQLFFCIRGVVLASALKKSNCQTVMEEKEHTVQNSVNVTQ